jgi:hypothetical protein
MALRADAAAREGVTDGGAADGSDGSAVGT